MVCTGFRLRPYSARSRWILLASRSRLAKLIRRCRATGAAVLPIPMHIFLSAWLGQIRSWITCVCHHVEAAASCNGVATSKNANPPLPRICR